MYIFSKAVHTTNSQWTPSFDDYQREINTYPPLWKPLGLQRRSFRGFFYAAIKWQIPHTVSYTVHDIYPSAQATPHDCHFPRFCHDP